MFYYTIKSLAPYCSNNNIIINIFGTKFLMGRCGGIPKPAKNGLSAVKQGNIFNVPAFLELLNTTTDIDVQVKLFSSLSASLMLNNADVATIITYNPLYDKICKILTNCPPRKATVALNFLSSLLYVDQDSHRTKSLIVYAKNMIRSSGCLASMCDLFTSGMMYQEAWHALCRSIAEACRGIEVNQSYCTHLVPMCVQRCSLRNIEVLLVLQSLLQNHNRNINLFTECNGMSLFQREFLQHDITLQLLATIAQSSSQAVALIVKSNICQQLRNFLHIYGPQSQLGQWATIILYHTSRAEGSRPGPDGDKSNKLNQDLNVSFFNKINPKNQNHDLECSRDTTHFFQNVMKEIMQGQAQEESKNLKAFPSDISMNGPRSAFYCASRVHPQNISQNDKVWIFNSKVNNSYSKYGNTCQDKSSHFNKTKELSFSFLRKQQLNHKRAVTLSKFVTPENISASFQKTLQNNASSFRSTIYQTFKENSASCLNTDSTIVYFKPKFASTPKKIGKKHNSTHVRTSTQNTSKSNQIKRRFDIKRSYIDKEIKQRSLSGRVFDVINTSCTTLIKTVKNIFRPKTERESLGDSSIKTSNQDTLSCSYSFTNYMRNRDAILNKNDTNQLPDSLVGFKSKENVEDCSMEISSNSCNTCNDTIILKRKLSSDKRLKQTIRKLKLGINLYGCDFKKIVRVMWPNESYMTPSVLYHLYRKLIIK